MNILHLCTFHKSGASRAAQRLHNGLLQHPSVEASNFLTLESANDVPHLHAFNTDIMLKKTWLTRPYEKYKFWQFNRQQIRPTQNQPPLAHYFSSAESFFDLTQHPLYQKADIIHLHWVSHFLDIPSFFTKNKKPVVWTLHDTQPLTGGCHAPLGCQKWADALPCQHCPQLSEKFSATLAHHQFLAKQNAIAAFIASPKSNPKPPCIVAPSQWLSGLAKQSKIFSGCQHFQIYAGVGGIAYPIIDQGYARTQLGLPQQAKILLFVSDSLNNYHKGFQFLEQAVAKMNLPNVIICTVGEYAQTPTNSDARIFWHLGKISDEQKLALAYSAADYFVTPSLADNLPNVVVESLFCGTPVVGFPVGGIVEMIEDGTNGYLCAEATTESLIETLQKALSQKYLIKNNNTAIRHAALEKYSLPKQIDAYLNIYQNLLSTP